MNAGSVRRILLKTSAILGTASLVCLTGCTEGTPSTPNPTPMITFITPSRTLVGSEGFTLTVNGTNFVATSMVNFGGMEVASTFVSSTELQAAIPAAALASTGTPTVTVSNPAPGGGASNAANFTIGTNPVAAITNLVPPSIAAGGSAFTLVVFGSNLVGGSVVEWNGSARPTTVIFNSATAQISASDIAQSGTAVISVFNPTPGGGTSNALNFSVGTNPVPTASLLDPSCAPVGAQAFTLWVNGSSFLPGSVVMWNGSARPTTVTDSFNLSAQISADDVAEAGTNVVTVFNPPPGGGSSSTFNFTTATGSSPMSIAIDSKGKFAYVADQGCPDTFNGRVSMFTIDSTTGALTSIGTPIDSGDFGGQSVAVDPSGKFVYVANWGEGDSVGSVSAYDINSATGALTSAGNIAPLGTVPGPGSVAPWSVAVHPSGKFVYVADEGGLSPTSVSVYPIDPTNGTLTLTAVIPVVGRAVSVAVDPTGKFLYAADQSDPPGSPGNISMFTVNGFTSVGTVATGTDPASVVVDPTGKFLYAANSGSNNVSMYTIDSTTGALTSIGLVAAGASPIAVAVDPTGKFAYVADSTSNDVSMYTIDTTTGALTFTGVISAGLSPSSIAIHPSGNFAYVTNSGSNNISIYSINSTTGALTFVGTVGT